MDTIKEKKEVLLLYTNNNVESSIAYLNGALEDLGYTTNDPETFEVPSGTQKHLMPEYKHIHILSKEPIKTGDYYWDMRSINKSIEGDFVLYISRKVIASTDTSLGLPGIPKEFIDYYMVEYSKDNVIEFAEVEYQIICNRCQCNNFDECWSAKECSRNHSEDRQIPKINEDDNTITINASKENYSKDEVITLIQKYRMYAALKDNLDLPTCNKFIEDNL